MVPGHKSTEDDCLASIADLEARTGEIIPVDDWLKEDVPEVSLGHTRLVLGPGSFHLIADIWASEALGETLAEDKRIRRMD